MFQYCIFYKPYEVLSQFSEEGGKKTLAHFLSHLPRDVYPVGRLDYDSEGLLLLTNDKALTHELLEPRFAHCRTYWVQVEGSITEEALRQLRDGVLISIGGKRHRTKAALASRLHEPAVPERTPPIRFRQHIPTSWIALSLAEGKNRQVRRMTAAVGFPTLRLIRHGIGEVSADGMQPGEWRMMSAGEREKLLRKL